MILSRKWGDCRRRFRRDLLKPILRRTFAQPYKQAWNWLRLNFPKSILTCFDSNHLKFIAWLNLIELAQLCRQSDLTIARHFLF